MINSDHGSGARRQAALARRLEELAELRVYGASLKESPPRGTSLLAQTESQQGHLQLVKTDPEHGGKDAA